MDNKKMTWVRLRKTLAQRSGISEQEAGAFLDALLASVINGLKTDKQVRIKGLGTFALKPVAPRKSVNISTGETFTIAGYNKVTFSAESSLKSSVERRIAKPNTQGLIDELSQDPMQKLGQQADEIVDILAELGQNPQTAETTTEATTATAPSEPPTQEPPTPIQTEETNDEPQQPTQAVETADKKTLDTKQDNKSCCNKATAWTGWIMSAILLLFIASLLFYFRAPLQQWWTCMRECQPTVQEQPTETPAEPIITETPTKPVIVDTPTPDSIPLAEQQREYTDFIATEKVGFGSRLTWIAYKYYGTKDLWVFIYEANRENITSPNMLKFGQELRIPRLDEQWTDTSNLELRQLLDDLSDKYLHHNK